jgi:hypothetical protein
MISTEPLEEYAILLATRLRATRRDVIVVRWLFLLAMAGFFPLGVLGRLHGASAFMAALFVTAFGAGYFTIESRYETLRGIAELVEVLRRRQA